MTVIDLHILQAYPPSLLNRDDLGQPKTTVFGGVTRTRVSSQALKRAQRLYTASHGLVPDANLATRTRHLPRLLAERLEEAHGVGRDESLMLALNTVWGMGLLNTAGDARMTTVLLFLGAGEIEYIASVVASRRVELLGWSIPPERIGARSGAESDKPRGTRERKADCPPVFRELGKHLLGSTDSTKTVDVALYGRFLAEDARVDVDGASSTAHAFSIGEHHLDLDYYAAVDDVDGRGAGFLDTGALTAPVLYRYSNLDTTTLTANLGGSDGLARLATASWLTAAIHSLPRGKATSTAPATRPVMVLAVVRRDQALSMANAFLRPVRPTRESDLGHAGVAALSRHWAHLGESYGHDDVSAAFLVHVGDPEDLPAGMPGDVVSAADLVTKTTDGALARAAVAA
jgi:CRISPR system Cascade subunit CasC